MKWKLGCLATFVLVIGAPVLASRYLPWWGTIMFLVAEGILLLWGVPKLFVFGAKRVAIGLFTTKSRVLRGAMCQVHEVRLTTPPVIRRELTGESAGTSDIQDSNNVTPTMKTTAGTRFILIDFTITPRPGQSRMTHYEPSELMLIPFDRKISLEKDPTDSGDAGTLRQIRLVDDAGAETEELDKLTGPARYRAIFECPPTLTGRAKLQYYFETFGDLMLPE